MKRPSTFFVALVLATFSLGP
jgi:hypothetical protein